MCCMNLCVTYSLFHAIDSLLASPFRLFKASSVDRVSSSTRCTRSWRVMETTWNVLYKPC